MFELHWHVHQGRALGFCRMRIMPEVELIFDSTSNHLLLNELELLVESEYWGEQWKTREQP